MEMDLLVDNHTYYTYIYTYIYIYIYIFIFYIYIYIYINIYKFTKKCHSQTTPSSE